MQQVNVDTDLTPFTKVNSKWITDPSVKCKTVPFIGDNAWENVPDFLKIYYMLLIMLSQLSRDCSPVRRRRGWTELKNDLIRCCPSETCHTSESTNTSKVVTAFLLVLHWYHTLSHLWVFSFWLPFSPSPQLHPVNFTSPFSWNAFFVFPGRPSWCPRCTIPVHLQHAPCLWLRMRCDSPSRR